MKLRVGKDRIRRFGATFTVLFRARSRVSDLTPAILYRPAAEPYDSIALLLWRTKN